MSTYAERVKILQLDLSFPESCEIALDVAVDIASEADREIQMLRDTLETCLDCLGDEFALPSDVIDEVRGALKR